MVRHPTRRVTIAQAVVLLLGAVVIVPALAWLALPGVVVMDTHLSASQVAELREVARSTSTTESIGAQLTAWDPTAFVGNHECALPVQNGDLDGGGGLRRYAAKHPESVPYLLPRLDEERARCAEQAAEHRRLALPVLGATIGLVGLGVFLLRGRGRPLGATFPAAVAAAPGPDVDATATSPSPPRPSSLDQPGSAAPDALVCRRCHGRISPFLRPMHQRTDSQRLCDACLAQTGRVPMFLLGAVSAVLLALGVVLSINGNQGLAAAALVAGFAVPVFSVNIVVHELGHAFAGLALGATRAFVQLGSGAFVDELRLRRLSIAIHLSPTSGCTISPIGSRRLYRVRSWLLVAAGPLVTSAVVAAAWQWSPQGPLAPALRWLVIGEGVFLVVANLVPVKATSGLETDGRKLLTIPFLSREKIDERIAWGDLLIVMTRLARGFDLSRLDDADRAAIERSARAGHALGAMLWFGLVAPGDDWALGAEAARLVLASDAPMPDRSTYLNHLAWSLHMLDQVEPGGEADRASREALELDPSSVAAQGTRAEILARIGQVDEARAVARAQVDAVWTADGAPRWTGATPPFAAESYCVLAYVEACAGDTPAARAALANAVERDAEPRIVERVSRSVDEAARPAVGPPA